MRTIRHTLALFTLSVCLAAAQQVPPPTARQSLNDAWWTGPLLAPNASTLPRGHLLIEPYLYDVVTQGFYDSHGAKQSTPHANEFGSLTYINYGLADKLTVGLIPVFGYNEVAQGPNSSSIGAGDLTVQAQYRFHLFHEGSWIPTTSIAVQETLPRQVRRTWRSPQRRPRRRSLYHHVLFLQPDLLLDAQRPAFCAPGFNVTQAFSRSVNVEDVSVYGTAQGFRGRANPGAALFVDSAWEYSVTRRWVLALDATYRHQYNTPVTGYNVSDPNALILLNSGPSQAFALAPAFEYNFNSRVGVILGTRLFPAGKNTTDSINPVIAINIVH